MREARKLGIPVVAVVDTNCDPSEVDYVIPGNDDALRAIRLFASKISDSVAEGAQLMTDKQAADLAAAVYTEPEAVPAAEAADEACSREALPKPAPRTSAWKTCWAPGMRKQPAAAEEAVDEDVPQVETPDVLEPVVGLQSLAVGQDLGSEGNQTRAGRPARVKVCKDSFEVFSFELA